MRNVIVSLLTLLMLCTNTIAQTDGDIIIRSNINSQAKLEAIAGFDIAVATGQVYSGVHDFSGTTFTPPVNQNFTCIKIATTTCLCASSDRIYHDTDCNSTKDAGEEFIDFTSGTSMTVRTIDGTTTVSNVNEVRVTNGALTNLGGGVIEVTTAVSGEPSPWADTNPVRLDTETNDVRIGPTGATASKLGIIGTTDKVQVVIKGNATQTNHLFLVETSAGVKLAHVDNNGDVKVQSIQDIDGPGTLWSIDVLGNINGVSLTVIENVTIRNGNELRLADNDSSNYVGWKSPATVTTNAVYTMPATDGSAGQFLKTDGAKNTQWDTPPGGGGSTESCDTSKNINNPETYTVTGVNNEFGPLFYFKNAATITRVRSYVIGGTSLAFTLYECTVGTNCTAPTLSAQGVNGATMTVATTTPDNDVTFSNSSIAADNEIWIQVDKDHASTIGPITLFFIAICYTIP